MISPSQERGDLPRVPYRQAPLVLLLLAVAVLAITWPWAANFATATFDHWDPPFHAWKLELVARSILAGHLLPPDGNTNVYYPHPGTLYFEALHWPQAVAAAALFGLTNFNSLLVYHLVLVFFWALSGLCFWMLLHALGATRGAAWLGAMLFVLMPYRISYAVEFNMQLCFGLPLFFFFMVRYFQRPSIRYACGMAVAWWLQASSELYQAVFLLLILPFPGLALLAARWRLLGDVRRFWLPVVCAAALGGTLTYVLLGPYLTLLNVHAVNRNLLEIATHVLEPFSYLRPGGRFHLLASFDARHDEMVVYPTLAVILLASAHLVFDARRLAAIAVPRWVTALRAVRWTALIAFAGLSFFIYFTGSKHHLQTLYGALPVVACAFAVLVLLHPTARDAATLFVTGLFAGAVFAFFMSMGPLLLFRHTGFYAPNPVYVWLYNHLTMLQGFRVISRFSIYVLIYMVIAAALAWSWIERRWLARPALRALWLAPLLLAAVECIPRGPLRFSALETPYATPVLDFLDRREQPYVLAVVPMGQRSYDSRHMLQIGRSDRLFVYAWGGAYPAYTRAVRDAFAPAKPQPAEAARLLRQLWPECLLLEDKPFARDRRPAMMFRPDLNLWRAHDYADFLSAETEVLATDDRFVLMRLKNPAAPAPEYLKLVRRDLLAAHPHLAFRARVPAGAPPAVLWLDVNGYPAGRWTITDESQEFRLAVPAVFFVDLLPNRLRFHAEGDAEFFLDDFNLAAPGPDLPPPANGGIHSASLPWLDHIEKVPATAVPLDVRYRNGFKILACEPLETVAAPGGTIRLRYFVRCPRDLQVAANSIVRTRLRAPDGQWIEEGISLADTGDLQDVRCQLQPGIYDLDLDISIPERLPPGDYETFVLLRNPKEKRLAGVQNGDRAKLFPVPIPIRIQAPAAP